MRDQIDATTRRSDAEGSAACEARLPGDLVGELAEEFLDRHRRGERPSLEEYAAAHPELAGEIRRVFPALVMMEDLRPESKAVSVHIFGTQRRCQDTRAVSVPFAVPGEKNGRTPIYARSLPLRAGAGPAVGPPQRPRVDARPGPDGPYSWSCNC
jgi:hypothetical protein